MKKKDTKYGCISLASVESTLDLVEIELIRNFLTNHPPRSRAARNHEGTRIPKRDRKLNLPELFLSFGGAVHRKSSQYRPGGGREEEERERASEAGNNRSITIIMENDRDRSGT